MAKRKVFARVTAYYVARSALDRNPDNGLFDGLYNMPQTRLGDLVDEIELSELEEVLRGEESVVAMEPIELSGDREQTVTVGYSDECDISLPGHLVQITGTIGKLEEVHLELFYGGKMVHMPLTEYWNRVNGAPLKPETDVLLDPRTSPIVITLADWKGDISRDTLLEYRNVLGKTPNRHQTQAVLVIDYDP